MVGSLVAFDEFVEAAGFAVLRLVLVEKGQLVLVENLEEALPVDFLQSLFRLAEIYAQYAALAAVLDAGRMAIALLRPFADFPGVGGGLGFAHRTLHCWPVENVGRTP